MLHEAVAQNLQGLSPVVSDTLGDSRWQGGGGVRCGAEIVTSRLVTITEGMDSRWLQWSLSTNRNVSDCLL